MPSDRQSTRPGSNDASTPDGFDEIVTGYVDRLNDGEDLNPFEILAAHPEYGPEILRRLEVYATLESDNKFLDTTGKKLGCATTNPQSIPVQSDNLPLPCCRLDQPLRLIHARGRERTRRILLGTPRVLRD